MSLTVLTLGPPKCFMWKATLLMVIVTTILCEELTLYSKVINKCCNQFEYHGLEYQVNPKYPGDFSDCILETHNTSKHLLCGNLCSDHVHCHLYCLTQDGECMLSKARVSWHWKGVVDPQSPSWNCFSSWGNSNDAMPNASLSASVTFAPGKAEKEMAVNGYICTLEDWYMYKSAEAYRPWWAADLGVVRRVTSVRILTRPGFLSPSRVKNVEVRVGVSNPGNGDFTGNALLGFYKGEAPQNTVITFKATRPLAGSVVSVQSLEENYHIVFADVQVLYVN